MKHELICEWLQLPPGKWPPDHYTLLGLEHDEPPGEHLEREVHDRLETVRRYQLTNPEEATEAMNRLARAFVCLTDPAARRAYDAELLGRPAAVAEKPEPPRRPEAAAPVRPAEPAPREPPRVVGWQALPPPPPAPPSRPPARADLPAAVPRDMPPPPSPAAAAEEPVEEAPSGNGPAVPLIPAELAAPAPAAERMDPAAEIARSPEARRGLGTKRALYRRLARTRELARAWEEAGRYLAWPKRRIARPAEATELMELLGTVRQRLRSFPPLLGEAGQPGYLVATLSRQPAVVPTFQTLLVSQREALARDWWAGRTVLSEHREFLRQELRTMRKKSSTARAARAAWAFLTDQPGRLLLLLALLALNVAIWRNFFAAPPEPPPPPPTAPAPNDR